MLWILDGTADNEAGERRRLRGSKRVEGEIVERPAVSDEHLFRKNRPKNSRQTTTAATRTIPTTISYTTKIEHCSHQPLFSLAPSEWLESPWICMTALVANFHHQRTQRVKSRELARRLTVPSARPAEIIRVWVKEHFVILDLWSSVTCAFLNENRRFGLKKYLKC